MLPERRCARVRARARSADLGARLAGGAPGRGRDGRDAYPKGLFAVTTVWRDPPGDFLGAYVLPPTAHSETLRTYDGGNGRVAIHAAAARASRTSSGLPRAMGACGSATPTYRIRSDVSAPRSCRASGG